MPLVSLRIGEPNKGNSFTVLMEYNHGVNYPNLSVVINRMVSSLNLDANSPRLQKD